MTGQLTDTDTHPLPGVLGTSRVAVGKFFKSWAASGPSAVGPSSG